MLALTLSALLAQADAGSPGQQAVELLATQAAAWSRGELDAFCSVYADDAVFVSPSGITKGRAEVLARYKKKYPTAKDMGKLVLTPLDVRESPDAVSIAAKWELTYPRKRSVSGHTLIVLRRLQGQWLIVQDASM